MICKFCYYEQHDGISASLIHPGQCENHPHIDSTSSTVQHIQTAYIIYPLITQWLPQLLDGPWQYCDTCVQVILKLCWVTMPVSFTLFHFIMKAFYHLINERGPQYNMIRYEGRRESQRTFIQLLVTTVYYYNCSISLSSIILFCGLFINGTHV